MSSFCVKNIWSPYLYYEHLGTKKSLSQYGDFIIRELVLRLFTNPLTMKIRYYELTRWSLFRSPHRICINRLCISKFVFSIRKFLNPNTVIYFEKTEEYIRIRRSVSALFGYKDMCSAVRQIK